MYLRAFLRFCYEAAWIEGNPALALRPTKVSQRQTLPFTDEEVERLVVAARGLVRFGSYGPKMEPMLLLLRYSGLRIQDAACLERSRLTVDKLFVLLPRVPQMSPGYGRTGGMARWRQRPLLHNGPHRWACTGQWRTS